MGSTSTSDVQLGTRSSDPEIVTLIDSTCHVDSTTGVNKSSTVDENREGGHGDGTTRRVNKNNEPKVPIFSVENAYVFLGSMIAAIATILSFDKTLFAESLEAEVHLIFLTVCIFGGILCFFYGVCLSVVCQSKCCPSFWQRFGRVLLKIGMGATAYALVATAGHLFPEPAMYWWTLVLLVACTPPIFCIVVRY
ncbi:uncharacterized protein LOC116125952 [Pistacia vera]|uniref:uncharacterized protein LOC116125952 n=1 Tax=Pistacia vera TaxID=55513 RepID=UPI00126379E8|nr:uncharacterized protein LOC116125952 [Pistacia vera]